MEKDSRVRIGKRTGSGRGLVLDMTRQVFHRMSLHSTSTLTPFGREQRAACGLRPALSSHSEFWMNELLLAGSRPH